MNHLNINNNTNMLGSQGT